jgi:hypothetical protein
LHEDFVWDGLALINRSTTYNQKLITDNDYLIEPHPNGGSPILSTNGTNGTNETSVLFNDMLGSSLGTVENGEFSAIDRDSFGSSQTTDNEQPTTDFWTGKPNVEGLGYVFLMRNYRSEIGKWQTSDLLGYPDGWNNLAYVNNWVTSCYDWLGAATSEVRFRNVVGTGGAAVHPSLHLTVTADEFNSLPGRYQVNWKDDPVNPGSKYVWISAFQEDLSPLPGDAYLNKRYNDPSDDISLTQYPVNINSGVQGSLEFIKKSLEFVKDYENNVIDYDWSPNDGDEGNSNSFIGTLTDISGGTVDRSKIPSNAYGWDHKMDKKYFE